MAKEEFTGTIRDYNKSLLQVQLNTTAVNLSYID